VSCWNFLPKLILRPSFVPIIRGEDMLSFSICSANHHLEVVDRRSTTFRSEHIFKIRANTKSRFFVRDFIWTGSGEIREKPPEVVSAVDIWGIPKHRMHGPLLVEGSARTLVVDLGRTLSVGEEETVCFRHEMKDLKGTFKPRLRMKPSTEFLECLDMRVTLPQWAGLRCLFREFSRSNDKVLGTEKIEGKRDSAAKISFHKQIVNPNEKNVCYGIEWSHNED
jgi:hypothetical protein